MKEFVDMARAKAAPYIAAAQFAIALLLMAMILLTVFRLAGWSFSSLPQIDRTGLAYACGSFWAVTRAWS